MKRCTVDQSRLTRVLKTSAEIAGVTQTSLWPDEVFVNTLKMHFSYFFNRTQRSKNILFFQNCFKIVSKLFQ